MALPNLDDIKALAGGAKRDTSAYDTRGVVTKVADGTVYVKLEGSEIETPIDSTSAYVVAGDVVSVHVSHGDTTIVGNRSAPATDDTTANTAMDYAGIANRMAQVAKEGADIARASAESAVIDAATAKAAAEGAVSDAATANTAAAEAKADAASASRDAASAGVSAARAQAALDTMGDYDWDAETFDPNASLFYKDSMGAHIVDARGAEGKYRTDINSSGMDITEIATGEVVASFGANEARVGRESDDRTMFTRDGVRSFHMVEKSAPTEFIDTASHALDGNNKYQFASFTIATGSSDIFASAVWVNSIGAAPQQSIPITLNLIDSGGSVVATVDSNQLALFGKTYDIQKSKAIKIASNVAQGSYTLSVFIPRAETLGAGGVFAYAKVIEYSTESTLSFSTSQGSMNIEKDLTVGGGITTHGNDIGITEKGTANNWSYTKYDNGEFDAYSTRSFDGAVITTAQGSMYTSQSAYTISLPFENKGSSLDIVGTVFGMMGFLTIESIASTSVNFRFVATNSGTKSVCRAKFYIHGRWK